MRHTPAAVMDAGACSWAAMGSARARVTPLGTSARASSANAALSLRRALGQCMVQRCCSSCHADAKINLLVGQRTQRSADVDT